MLVFVRSSFQKARLVALIDHVHPTLKHFFPTDKSALQYDNVPTHEARVVTQRPEEHDIEIIHTPWPAELPDPNPIEHLWERRNDALPETAFTTSINKSVHRINILSVRVWLYLLHGTAGAGRLYATVSTACMFTLFHKKSMV